MIMFRKRKLIKRLSDVGSRVDTSYMCYVNNDDAISFPSYDDVISYLKTYRQETTIFKLQIFRIETYSL